MMFSSDSLMHATIYAAKLNACAKDKPELILTQESRCYLS